MAEPDTDWIEVGESPTVRTRVRFRELADGSTDMDIHQELIDPQAFLDQIAIERAAAEANGFRDGAIIGRVPDALYWKSGLHEARQQDDKPWLRKFWNNGDHAKLRIKGGTI